MKADALLPHTLQILKESGWKLGRKANADSLWVEPLEGEGYRAFPIARSILEELGGLRLNPPRREDYLPMSAHFDPLDKCSGEYGRMELYEERAGEHLFPLGEAFHYRMLLVGESGKIYLGDTGQIFLLAQSIEEGLDYMISINPKRIKL